MKRGINLDNNMHKRINFLIMMVAIIGVLLVGCSKDDNSETYGKSYKATAKGYGGDVTVDVTVATDGKINAIKVDAPDESPDKGGVAVPKIAEEIIATQSLSVDAVSGATVTSNAVLSATEKALKDAGVDTEALKNK